MGQLSSQTSREEICALWTEGHDYAFGRAQLLSAWRTLASFASFHSIAGSGSRNADVMAARPMAGSDHSSLRAAPNGFASIRRVAISSVDKAMITSPCRVALSSVAIDRKSTRL